MNEHIADRYPRAGLAPRQAAKVIQLSNYLRHENVLDSVTFYFGGQHFGTFAIKAPIPNGTSLRLYVVGQDGDPASRDGSSGQLDCLVTDDACLTMT